MDDAAACAANSFARRDLTRLYAAAVSAVAPAHLIGRALGGELEGAEKVPVLVADASRIFLLAAGKAALAIVPSLRVAGDPEPQAGTSGASREAVRTIAAAHPLPDGSSQRAAEAAL